MWASWLVAAMLSLAFLDLAVVAALYFAVVVLFRLAFTVFTLGGAVRRGLSAGPERPCPVAILGFADVLGPMVAAVWLGRAVGCGGRPAARPETAGTGAAASGRWSIRRLSANNVLYGAATERKGAS
ncbi:hypothetical protein TV39_12250 [Arthrobacter sp. SPG23]|nr:hypothetical protein TV39_12250 [Arthrobacter sp. SPG23]